MIVEEHHGHHACQLVTEVEKEELVVDMRSQGSAYTSFQVLVRLNASEEVDHHQHSGLQTSWMSSWVPAEVEEPGMKVEDLLYVEAASSTSCHLVGLNDSVV